MWKSPFLRKLFAALAQSAKIALVLLAALVGLELLRAFRMFWSWKHVAGLAFVGVVALVTIWLAFKLARFLAEHRLIRPPRSPEQGATSHDEMVEYSRYQIQLLKRLSQNPDYAPDQQKSVRQYAYDIEEVLSAHPLLDDLQRSIRKINSQIIAPLQADARARAEALTRERIKSVLEDVIEPPFPVAVPFVVFYVQLMLVTRIADFYWPRLALREYGLILRDVFDTLATGRFFKLGHSLFAGIYANSPPLGPAVDDLGQSLTTIWLTTTVSQAVILRCETTEEWDTDAAVEKMNSRIVEMLAQTKDSFLRDGMPILRLRIRHSAPPGTPDAAGFSEIVSNGIALAIDSVVRGYKNQSPEQVVATARRTMSGDGAPLDEGVERSGSRERRRRRSRRRGPFGVLANFGQRLKYSLFSGHLKR